jgi:hypothetical protein
MSGLPEICHANHTVASEALGRCTFKGGTKIPDKSSGLNHITEALGYLIMGVFPILTNTWSIHPQLV